MTEPKTGLELLREPFPANQINKLPKPYTKDAKKGRCAECGGYHGLPAAHLDYVGHAALTARLLDADPEWTWEPVVTDPNTGAPLFDGNGGLWIRLTVCGVTRLGYGDAQGKTGGNAVKEAIGDALRNAGMRFGAALDLWHKGDLYDADDERGTEPQTVTAPKNWRQMIASAPSMPDLVAVYNRAEHEGWRTKDVMDALSARKGELQAEASQAPAETPSEGASPQASPSATAPSEGLTEAEYEAAEAARFDAAVENREV